MAYTGAVNLYPIRKGSLADHLSLSDIAYKRVIAASCITPTRSAVFWQALGESIWFKPSYNGNTLEIKGERIVRFVYTTQKNKTMEKTTFLRFF
jgi:hypothetical protein